MQKQPNIIEEVVKDGITFRRHADYPMFSVSEGGKIIGAKGNLIDGYKQASGHLYLTYYVEKKTCFIHAHRLVALCYVLNPDPETLIKVDHKDINPANNHYTNLRWVTQRQNCQNLAKNVNGETSSRFVGVSWKKREQRWVAQIRIDGKNKGLGSFKVEEDAARAYDKALTDAGLAAVNASRINV